MKSEIKIKTIRFKHHVPSLIVGNVRSLGNKMEELMALTRSQREYQECSLMCFTESWLHQEIPNDNVSIDGYETVQGLSILVNNRWFSPAHITVKEIICCPDMELLDSNHLICLGSFHILSW